MDGNKNNIVISVGRQFGCKGRVIGKALAERFGFSFYDAELLNLAAKEIGFDPSMFEMADEKPGLPEFFQNVGQLLFGMNGGADSYLSSAKLFEIQSEAIRHVAEVGPCVIMGRCSDYVLRDKSPRMVTVSSDFLYEIGDTYEDRSTASAFGEVLGVNLTRTEVQERIEPFVNNFFHWMHWSDTDTQIWMERKLNNTPPLVLANQLGRRRDWVDTRLFRLNERFREAFLGWYRVNA